MSIDIRINAFGNNVKIEYCSRCFGIGKLKVMQSIATHNRSVRGTDTEVKCKYCNGIGVIVK